VLPGDLEFFEALPHVRQVPHPVLEGSTRRVGPELIADHRHLVGHRPTLGGHQPISERGLVAGAVVVARGAQDPGRHAGAKAKFGEVLAPPRRLVGVGDVVGAGHVRPAGALVGEDEWIVHVHDVDHVLIGEGLPSHQLIDAVPLHIPEQDSVGGVMRADGRDHALGQRRPLVLGWKRPGE